jgi:predicted Zn-dependent peptidase
MSSRLFQTIREEEALCYSISCFRTLFSDCSLWTVYTSTKSDQVAPLVRALNREFVRLHSEPLTPTEVEDAKSFLKGSLILSKENMEIRMKRLVRMQHITGRVMEYEDSLGLIDAVKVHDVSDFVQSTVRSSEFNFLAFGGKRIPGFRDWAFDF